MLCEDIELLLPAFLDKELEKEEELMVQKHLKNCNNCLTIKDSLYDLKYLSKEVAEEVPFFLKNRLLNIPENMNAQIEEENRKIKRNRFFMKIMAATIGFVALLLNIFYFTNLVPSANFFVHKSVARVQMLVSTSETLLGGMEDDSDKTLSYFLQANNNYDIKRRINEKQYK